MDLGTPLDSKQYHSLRFLTEGTYGQVFIAQDQTGKEVVIKKIPKNKEPQRIINEIIANRSIPQTKRGICQYHGFFESANCIYLVFDRVKGCDLFQLMEQREFSPLPEAVIRRIMQTLLPSLVHCHNHGVAHRDVKLENIVVDAHLTHAVLIDFGLCSFFQMDSGRESLTTDCGGSLEYIAPEVLWQRPFQATPVDAWSLGITIYCLVFGQFPFNVTDSLAQGCDPWSMNGQECVALPEDDESMGISASPGLRHVLSGLLRFDATKRCTLRTAAEHPWFLRKKEGHTKVKLDSMNIVV